MNTLLLYIKVTDELIPMIPTELAQCNSGNTAVLDIDQRSGPELIQVARNAMDLADRIILAVDIGRNDLSVQSLFPIFKYAHRNQGKVIWIQRGKNASIDIFLHDQPRQQITDSAKFREEILEVLKTN